MASGVLIAGAGPAGITIAESLRRHEPALPITLISAEPHAPYSPPAMADYFTTGRREVLFWKGEDVCERLAIDYRAQTTIRALDGAAKELLLDDGSRLAYQQLVIATGSGLYAPLPGYELDGVYNFKSLSVAARLVEQVRAGSVGRVVIVGGGFIGVELALLLRSLGVAVVIVDRGERLMHEMLDPETAELVLDRVCARGIDVRLETAARAFVGSRHAEAVLLESGEELRADAYAAATGVKPNVGWLRGSSVSHEWGVTVDEYLRADTGGAAGDDIWAAGDVAETCDRLTGERYVHAMFPNAIAQARVVTSGLLGRPVRYEGAEAMNSLKHLGVEVMAVGASTGEEVLRVRRGNVLRKLFLSEGRIIGFRLAGDISAAGVYRSLMLRRVDVTRWRRRLLDVRPGAVWLSGLLAD